MTNYYNYPKHRFFKNTCIIVFGYHSYSWCFLSESQKKYLATSGYIDDAQRLDVRTSSGKIYSMTQEQFKEWVKSDAAEPDSSLETTSKEAPGNPLCPICGKALVIRTAKVGPNKGKQFLGCSGFPECKYTRSND